MIIHTPTFYSKNPARQKKGQGAVATKEKTDKNKRRFQKKEETGGRRTVSLPFPSNIGSTHE